MKKLLIALPVIAGAAWAGGSYYAGMQSEAAYDNLLAQMDFADPYLFEKESFEQGLNTSHATTLVKESHSADAAVVMKLNHEINHSPVRMGDEGMAIGTVTIRTTIADASDSPTVETFKSFFADETKTIEILSTADMSGDVTSEITVGDFEVAIPESNDKVAFTASNVTIVTADGRSAGEGTIGAITVNGESDQLMTLSESSLAFDVAVKDSWAHGYDLTWSLDELSVQNPDLPSPVKVSGVAINTSASRANTVMNYEGEFLLTNIDMGDMMPRDTAPVHSAKVDFTLDNVNIENMGEYIELVQKMTVSEQLDEDQIYAPELLAAMKKMLGKDMALSYGLNFTNAGGDADALFSMSFIGDDSATGYDDIVTLTDLLNAMESDLTLDADKAALELTPAAMVLYSPEAGMALVDQGDTMTSAVTMRGTTIDVNGNLFPLDQMMGDMLNLPITTLIEMQGL